MKAPTPTQRRLSSILPSKKILPIIAACIVIVGIIALIFYYNPKSNATNSGATLAVINQTEVHGLANKIYQKIQAELAQVATSSTSGTIATSSTGASANNASTNQPLNATQALSQEFIKEYTSLKQSGQQLTASDTANLIPNLITNGNIASYIPQAKVFTTQDIVVNQNNSSAAYKTYGNTLGTVLIKNQPPSNLNELAIFQKAVNSNNPNDLTNLAIIEKAYSGIVNGFDKVPVPSQVVPLDLTLLNDLSQLLNSIQGMQKLFTDPITAIAAVQNYGGAADAVQNDLSAVNLFFAKQGITFSHSEPGAIFAYFATQ